jgi:hypothetical protein
MKRLTVHLKRVKKELIDDKWIIRNTLSFNVNDDEEANFIINKLSNENPKNNISKWYLSNV